MRDVKIRRHFYASSFEKFTGLPLGVGCLHGGNSGRTKVLSTYFVREEMNGRRNNMDSGVRLQVRFVL
jgi:selenocysteine lyase/cysteine desulfurase